MNACEAVKELLSAHMLGALGQSEETLVTAHLAGCAACRAAEAETNLCVELIAAPPVKPPAELWGKICSTIDRTEAGTDPVRSVDPDVVISISCSFCRGGMTRPTAVYCASCLAPHHPECFSEYGRCSVMGCGELQIVRSEMPPPPSPPTPIVAPPAPKPARFKLLLGGLASVVLGGVAAAALIQYQSRIDPRTTTSSEQGAAFDLGKERYRIHVREATLDELIEEIEHETRASISIPMASRRARVGNILLRERTWEGVHWLEVLNDLAKKHKLKLTQLGPNRARLTHTGDFTARPRPRSRIPVRATYHVPSQKKPEQLHEGWDFEVVAAPRGEGVAVVRRDRIDVYWGSKPRGRTRQLETPPRGLSWSPDGRRLAYAYNTTVGGEIEGRVGLFLLRDRAAQQKNTYVKGLPPMRKDTSIAWLEKSHALAVTTKTGVVKIAIGDGSGIHLLQPRGGQRLQLHSLGGNKILAARLDKLEGYTVDAMGNRAEREFQTSTLAHGYAVDVSPGSKRALIRTPTLFVLLSLADGELDQQAVHLSQTGLARLAPSGQFLAWRATEGSVTYVRNMAGKTGWDRWVLRNPEDPVAINPAGFRWFYSDGDALLYWTDDTVTAIWLGVDDRGTPTVRDRWGPVTLPGTIRDAQWAGGSPVVTIDTVKRREAITQVRRVD